jgi:tRNA uracil 4-sulfurtransferase
MQHIVIHYDEIALKGRRRRALEELLVENVGLASPGLAGTPVARLDDRLLAGPLGDGLLDEALRRLGMVPGVAWYAAARRLPLQVETLPAAADDLPEPDRPRPFRVRATRALKSFPLDSVEIQRLVGREIQQRTGWPVNLERPELTVYLDITRHGALVYHVKHRGLGGLPVGAGGAVVCLLSGGIDSPVAALRMMCRGCRAVLVHFHNAGPDAAGVRGKIVRLAEKLAEYQPRTRLYLVPFAAIQADLIAAVPPKKRMVAYRRAMLRLAEPIRRAERAGAFVVGDSLGQVASQTLENIRATWPAAACPVLAPLIGENKRAIMDEARRIGTYDISILPYDDCCQRMVAASPATKCRLRNMEQFERRLPIEDHLEEVRREAEVIEWKK